jgi:hypothetical protein
VVTAAASWLVCAGMTVLGGSVTDPARFSDAVRLGTRLWLLANGVGVQIGTVSVTLVPWGVTAVLALMILRFARASARRVRADQTMSPWFIGIVTVATYLVPVQLTAMRLAQQQVSGRSAAVVTAFLLAAVWGSSRNLRSGHLMAASNRFAILRGVLAGQLVMLVAGAAVLVTSLGIHLKQVEALHDALQPSILGAVVLLLLQLAFAPNVLVWSASYALGSGFSIGAGSVVAPAGTQLGVVPAIPLLGALPVAGPGEMDQLWWLTAGAIAGAIACWVALSNRPAVRFDQASLRGGMCGLLAGGMFAAVAWAASGDLGAVRLTDMGPRLLPLFVVASTTMGLAGMITGLAIGLMPRRARSK